MDRRPARCFGKGGFPYAKRSKYGNRKVTFGGKTFDSKHECERYLMLLAMEQDGEIKGLQTQVPYQLIPSQKDQSGRVIERAVTYIADFVYTLPDGRTVVEDAKGFRTDAYKIKKKLMLYVHGIHIVEV